MKAYPFYILLIICNTITSQFLEKQKDLQFFKGYFNFYYNGAKDQIYLEVDKLETEFLYIPSLATGIGSNDIGLDRGKLGEGVVVSFKKVGNKLLLVQTNQGYRAITRNKLEKRSVEEAFATSVLF